MEEEGGAFFVRYDLFFPLDNQVARIFCPKKCLTALRVVTCVTHEWILVQAERGQLATFLKMVVSQERLYSGIMSHVRLGKYVWVWLVNEDDWARRLGQGLGQCLWYPQSLVFF